MEAHDVNAVRSGRLPRLHAIAVVAVVVLALGASACGDDDGGDASAASNGQIAVELPFRGLDIYAPTLEGARTQGRERGYEILEGFAGDNVDKAVNEINTWITQGVDGMVVLALQTNSFRPLVERAVEQGTKVVSWVNPVEGSNGTIQLDPVQGGQVLGKVTAEWIRDHLGGKANIVLIPNLQDQTTLIRVNTALDVIKEMNPQVKVVSRQSSPLGTPEEGLTIARDVLRAEPDANVWLPLNDSLALGIDQALQAEGRNLDDVYVTGWDGSKAALERMLEGDTAIKSVGAVSLFEAGKLAVDLTANAIEGKEPTTAPTPYTAVTIDDKASIQKFLAQYK